MPANFAALLSVWHLVHFAASLTYTIAKALSQGRQEEEEEEHATLSEAGAAT